MCHPYLLKDASVQELIERHHVGVNASCGHLRVTAPRCDLREQSEC